MIPQDKIDEILDRASIVAIAGESVELKKRGTNYVGRCPFHSEKTGSFSVSDERGLFHCFGCQEGGNVISFVMKQEGLDFPDAVRSIAARYGIEITKERGDGGKRDALFEANSNAGDFFFAELRKPTGLAARNYLKERDITKDVAATYRFGLAPDSWTALADHFKAKKMDLDAAVSVGVLGKKDGRYYDRFRGRVVVPILDARGRVIAFGGRVLADGEPKYLNSPDSPLFKKHDTLYGLNHARGEIAKKDYVLVSEGYFDLISLQTNGFLNSVATMGTALTSDHLRRLKNLCKRVYTIFDADDAGKKAALRGLGLFLDEEMMARVVLLPEGKDPDDILREEGQATMQELIDNAVPLFEFFLRETAKSRDMDSPEGKSGFLDEVLPFLRRIRNEAERAHYVEKVSLLLKMKSERLYAAMSKSGKSERSRMESREATDDAPLMTEEGQDAPGADKTRLVEETLLRVVLRHPALFNEKVGEAFALFKGKTFKTVAEKVAATLNAGTEFTGVKLASELNDEKATSWVSGVFLSEEDDFVVSPERMIEDCLKKIIKGTGLRETTLKQIELLEAAGKSEAAREIRERAIKGSTNC